jgi:carboxymethylenebutenolidase
MFPQRAIPYDPREGTAMGSNVVLTASDGHRFGAYEAKLESKPRGGLVVVQEIFGVNPHIRRVADGFAADGYHVIAPALFDRAEAGVELGYEAAEVERGRNLRQEISLDEMLLDIDACRVALAASGKIGLVGYCLGGSLAWLTATRLDGFAATVGYYGGMIAAHLDETPCIPVMLHFGEEDGGIPMADVAKIKAAADPALVQVFTYPGAGHAFNRDGTSAWRSDAAKLVRERTLAFLREHVW